MRRFTWLLALMLILSVDAFAQQTDLTRFLQAEVNEIAQLSAQSNYLQQQGDPLGAALVASYIPDHQLQAGLLANEVARLGGNPALITPNVQPVLGTRQQIIDLDIQQHQQASNSYRNFANDTKDPIAQRLAINGQSGAARHFSSLQIAQGAILGTPAGQAQSTIAALTLERSAIANLQVQASSLQQLGDPTTASALLALVPQHQQQADRLQALAVQQGLDPARAVPPTVVGLPSRDMIASAQRTFETQMVNTYAMPIALLPNSSFSQIARLGQQGALTVLAQLPGGLPIVAQLPAGVPVVAQLP